MECGMPVRIPHPHPNRALTAVRVKSERRSGRYADGNGLYLVVDPSGAKRWVLRTVVQGRRRDIGLGSLRLVSLAEAREKAAEYRKTARDGGDPLAQRQKPSAAPTFSEAAARVHAEHRHGWRNQKHAAQWLSSLSDYAFPTLGSRRVDEIETPDVLRVLSPIWLAKPETARRVRQRIGTVLDWAKAAGYRSGDNPVESVARGLPKQPEKRGHFTALPYAQVPGFIPKLRSAQASEAAKLALEFLILTAARTGEVLGARWKEVDLKQSIWTIPGARMKADREHRVPLTPHACRILKRAQALGDGGELVFPGRSGGEPMSNMVFLMILRRMGVNATAHGFRFAFRDWAAERTNFPREVCEMALAHSVENKTEAAYRRGDLLDKRRQLMMQWDAFITA
jgi:integrase